MKNTALKDIVNEIRNGKVLSFSFNRPCSIPAFSYTAWDKEVYPTLKDNGLNIRSHYNPHKGNLRCEDKVVLNTYKATLEDYPGVELLISVEFIRPDPINKPEFGILRRVDISFHKDLPFHQ